MKNDSVQRTLIVAALLCVVCSVLVSMSAVVLRPEQELNKKFDVKKNLLLASGLLDNPNAKKSEIESIYKKIQAKVIDLKTGEVLSDVDPETYDQKKAAGNPKTNVAIPSDKDKANIKKRAQMAKVYHVMDNGEIKMIVLPVHGKGLWSTMYGFLALAPDTTTVKGIGFYQHGETPGLGGEIDNPTWKAQWTGKKVYDEQFSPKLRVIKGSVTPNDPQGEHKIDGLSGATLTSNGVTGLVEYWLGDHGFGPYLANFRSKRGL